jgi:TPR repeat protein
LFFGDGVDRDSQLAFRLFSKASEKGSLNALNNVGVCITCGFHDLSKTKQTETSNAYVLPGDGPKDDEKGAVMFLKAAEAGCLTALINIGTCYRTGDGLEKDLTKALERWNAAARRGSSEAKCKIGTLSLFAGETKIAIGYYEDAARSGIGEAMFGAGTCRLNENDRSIDDTTLAWFEQAAEAGYPEAHYFLCKRYRHGSGVRKDKPKAQRHLEIGAYLGEPSAQLIMASRYDDSEHIFWLMRSAEQGTFKAQYMLGCIYEKGEEGQTKDVMLALRWFHAAVQNGSELAKEEIEALRSEVD